MKMGRTSGAGGGAKSVYVEPYTCTRCMSESLGEKDRYIDIERMRKRRERVVRDNRGEYQSPSDDSGVE